MISLFKKVQKNANDNHVILTKIAALLIYTAKIDEDYTKKESEIIKKTIIELGADKSNIDQLISDATIIEKNSNQILDFTREVKNLPEKDKIKIIESLWKIIYTNDNADIYETSLMRKLAGLIYVDAKIMGALKEKAKKEFIK
ncbi:TerB family tellurite resistance protein [Candidatus Pelagibacter sp.]|nr:TerB family tellurite resistance protein [Candidatus Pelagibacter sp.]